MSVRVMGMVWDLDLPHNEQLVLLALADHADHTGGSVYPSVALIAWKCGYKERQVQTIMSRLRERGILVPVAYEQGGRGHATLYRIDLSNAPRKPERPETKGAIIAPFSEAERVQSGAQRVQSGVKKGAVATAPQPSRTVIKPKTGEAAAPPAPVHPAVKVFQQVRAKFPPRETWDTIAETVGEQEHDLQLWRDVLVGYAAQGWNRQSVDGPLDWFKRREIPRQERKPASKSEQHRAARRQQYRDYDAYWDDQLRQSQGGKRADNRSSHDRR